MATTKRQPDETLETFHRIEIEAARGRYAELNDKYKHTLALLRESDERLDAMLGLKDAIGGHAPKKLKVTAKKGRGESVAVLVTSDWHIEERVDPKTVDGVNEYTPEIAERRIQKFFTNALSMVEMCRTRSRIDTCVLAVLGDLITGAIHEDLAESNYLSPTEATLKAYRLLCGGIDFLLDEGKFEKLLIPCSIGNHGRTTKRMRVSTAAKNSYEWMLYHLAAERYANDARVHFSIADGYLNFMDVYSTRLRIHHGEGIKYQGGVGGVTIPLAKAIAQWNKMKRADIDIMGHWHTRMTGRDYVVNGSVVGYGAYALSIKASFEPPQQSFFLIHPEYGKTVEIPLVLT